MSSYVFGVIFGTAVVFIVCFVAGMLLRRYATGAWNIRGKYDERQKVAQGLAYRAGFWTMVAALLLWFLAENFGVRLPFSTAYAELVIFMLGILVYVVECIFRDAYMGLTDNPRRWMVSDGVILAVNLVISYTNFRNGMDGWVNLICAGMMAVVMVAFIIKSRMNKNAEDGEDE